MIYKFDKLQVLKLNNASYTITVPKNSECVFVSEVPDYYIFQIISPLYLNRFKVQLPKSCFGKLSPLKNKHEPIYLKTKKNQSHKIKGKDPKIKKSSVSSQIITPFRSISIPELKLGKWYYIENYSHPLIRFDSYDNGTYYTSVPNTSGDKLLRLNVNEDELRKYRIRNACGDDVNKFCKNGLIYINKELKNV